MKRRQADIAKKSANWRAPSYNADNYRYCKRCCANKYCYETEAKAKTALKFNQVGCRRYYWCKSCCAYHLTSETKTDYWNNLDKITMKRYGTPALRAPLDRENDSAYTE